MYDYADGYTHPCVSWADPQLIIISQIMDLVNPISGKINKKIFFKKLLTNNWKCGIMVNSARVDGSRAAQ